MIEGVDIEETNSGNCYESSRLDDMRHRMSMLRNHDSNVNKGTNLAARRNKSGELLVNFEQS